MFQITLSCDESNRLTYAVNDKPVDAGKLAEILNKLGTLATNLQVNVIATERVSAFELTKMLFMIQSNGLHNVVLITPGSNKGESGYFSVSIDVAKRRIRTCIADIEMASGFHGAGDQDREILEALEKK